MTVRQITFVNPIGSQFLDHGLSVIEAPDAQSTGPDVFREMLDRGLTLVETRGVIARHQRKALALNTKYSKVPNPQTTTIQYNSDDEFEKRVELIGTRTTLNGRLKVLREAIVEVLEGDGVQIEY